MYQLETIAVVIPAYNEAEAIARVVGEIRDLRNPDGTAVVDDIIVCDNGSTDSTALIATAAGARVVYQSRRGYGAACQTAIRALHVRQNKSEAVACPDIVVFVDGDRSVAVEQLPRLLKALQRNDLVIGSRVLGVCERGAMSVPQRFGNRLASILIRLIWQQPVTDLGPFRAVRYRALQRLDMQDMAFGWTVEMQVKAIQAGLQMIEVPVSCRRRVGTSKISGTLRGVVGAGQGILGTIALLWWRQNSLLRQLKHHSATSK